MKTGANRSLMILGVVAAGVVLNASGVYAETLGKHPHYLHARSDLAKARQLLQQPDEERGSPVTERLE